MTLLIEIAWLFPAVFGLLAWIAPYVDYRLSGWRMRYLEELPTDGTAPLPRLSVIVAALNEEATLEPAMRSLLALDYPDLEVIAVDDRSTDHTGAILDSIAAEDGRLRVVHVIELPGGWLGKNHALKLGAEAASGDFLLFTDADVHFEPSALSRAVRFAVDEKLDHLVVIPRVVLHGFWETLCVWFFGVVFTMGFRPWRVRDPRSRYYTGVGAFNLVRRDAYCRIGGHAALPMEVGDDIKLGKLLKRSGARGDVVVGGEMVRVRWVEGVRGLVEGLTKNMYAGLAFSPVRLLGATVGIVLLAVWPMVGVFVGPPAARAVCCLTLLVMILMAGQGRPHRGASPLYGLTFPLGAVILIYTFWRSAVLTYRQGGIVWRGTLYPLDELRRGIV